VAPVGAATPRPTCARPSVSCRGAGWFGRTGLSPRLRRASWLLIFIFCSSQPLRSFRTQLFLHPPLVDSPLAFPAGDGCGGSWCLSKIDSDLCGTFLTPGGVSASAPRVSAGLCPPLPEPGRKASHRLRSRQTGIDTSSGFWSFHPSTAAP